MLTACRLYDDDAAARLVHAFISHFSVMQRQNIMFSSPLVCSGLWYAGGPFQNGQLARPSLAYTQIPAYPA